MIDLESLWLGPGERLSHYPCPYCGGAWKIRVFYDKRGRRSEACTCLECGRYFVRVLVAVPSGDLDHPAGSY